MLKRVGGGNCYGTLTRGSQLRQWQIHGALAALGFIVLGMRADYGRLLQSWLEQGGLS